MKMRRKIITWLSIGAVMFSSAVFVPVREVRADFWGGDIPILLQILVRAIEQIQALKSIIGATRETVSLLEDMNRGVKEVLRLAETAHVPIPKQVYDQARSIDEATQTARGVYGSMPATATAVDKNHYQSGVEGLYLSQDAFSYSTFLDKTGESVKSSAVVANQSAATRLTAESMGVLLHAVSHSNRLQAKTLEIESTNRLDHTIKENAEHESFMEVHSQMGMELKGATVSPLNSFGGDASSGGAP